jgi:SnoaL-like domain
VPVPDDPAGFIAAAERGINERDLDATAGVYADAARMESLTDGAVESFAGAAEIRDAWAGYLDAMRRRDFRLRKTLVATSANVVVNEWTGTLAGRPTARGIEYWVFDDDGRVIEHRLYTFLDAGPSTSPRQRLRLLLAYPRTAVAFLRAQAHRREGPG